MISIIMPAYNAADFIEEAIESVMKQTYQKFELIVVDDGSTDKTTDIVENFMKKDDRISLIRNKHGGVSQSRNTGIRAARYPWIALLDADDVFRPDRLQRQVDAMQKHPKVIVWGSYSYNIDTEGQQFGISRMGPTSIAEFHHLRNTGQIIMLRVSSSLFRKDIALKIGCYNSKYDSAEDVEFWDRMAEHGEIVVLPEPLVYYRLHDSSVTSHKHGLQMMITRYLEERNKARLENRSPISFEEFKANYERVGLIKKFNIRRDDRARRAYRNAASKFTSHRYLTGTGWLIIAIVNNPSLILKRLWIKFANMKPGSKQSIS